MVKIVLSDISITAPDLKDTGAECFMALDASGIIGRCAFKIEGERAVILRLQVNGDDFSLADGLLRAVMAYSEPRAKRVVCPGGQSALLDEFVRLTPGFSAGGEADIAAVLGSRSC